MQQQAKAGAIRKCFLFNAASPDTVERIAAESRVLRYPPGRMLFAAGDPADGLRIVLTGLVRVWIANEDGKELTLSLLEPGDPFGEIALLDGLPCTANATALEEAECVYLPKAGELRLTRKFSQTDLGQMLGVTREAINKRLMSLVHDGLMRLSDGHIIVSDPDALRRRGACARS